MALLERLWVHPPMLGSKTFNRNLASYSWLPPCARNGSGRDGDGRGGMKLNITLCQYLRKIFEKLQIWPIYVIQITK